MGRHRKRSSSKLKRNTVVALTGLIPAGAVTIASGYGASAEIPFLQTQSTAKQTAIEPRDPAVVSVAADASEPAGTVETQTPAAPAAPAVEPAPAELPAAGPLAVPNLNGSAYRTAERILAETDPGCNLHWSLLAGIGQVESSHAHNGQAAADGTLLAPIIGLRLDGSLPGSNVIMDTDGGALDGDPVYDRAVGPMQFLPQTWNHYATDGNGDGTADPQNLYDSAATTGKYLCDGGLNMEDPFQATQAILRYNNSMAYVANVLAWSVGYSTGIVPLESQLPRIH